MSLIQASSLPAPVGNTKCPHPDLGGAEAGWGLGSRRFGAGCMGAAGLLGTDWHLLAGGRRVWEGKVNCSGTEARLRRINSFPEGFWHIGCWVGCFFSPLSFCAINHPYPHRGADPFPSLQRPEAVRRARCLPTLQHPAGPILRHPVAPWLWLWR